MTSSEESRDRASWPQLPPNFQYSSFAEAIAVKHSPDPTIFTADIKRDWCIGLVPHGGYLLSLIIHTVSQYFTTSQPKLNQPDLITSHVEFLSRTAVGPATIHIIPLKFGRQFSTLRCQLLQTDPKTSEDRICIEALITQGNLTTEAQNGGIGLETRKLVDELPSRDGFEEWSVDEKIMSARPAVFRIHTLLPKGSLPHGAGRLGKSVREQWVKWKPENGTNFTVEALPFLADAFRPIPEQFGLSTFWYPTLSYGVDVKRKPSNGEGAWEWLYLRAEMSECANGRMGIDVVICEEGGEVVCTSRHTALIVSAERNSAGRVEGAKI